MRKKAKFWQGGGYTDINAEHAERLITDHDFTEERKLVSGETLNSKEELLYYRIFKDNFGEFEDLSWMGRTKGAPIS
jgi:asparagine synthase (glutamine-hydrolysing)